MLKIGKADYDLYVFKNPRADCNPNDCTKTTGSQAADFQSSSSANPEIASIPVVGSMTVLLVGKLLEAVFIRRALTWSGVRFGFCCNRRAAAPLTTGVAMLVPLRRI